MLVHTGRPDRGGHLTLGVSVSYPLPAARRAPLVIAQVNPRMPRTLGQAFLHRSQVDAWTPVDHPLLKLSNVVVAPPMAGVTRESMDRMAIMTCRNILSVLDGKPNKENAVNPEVFN